MSEFDNNDLHTGGHDSHHHSEHSEHASNENHQSSPFGNDDELIHHQINKPLEPVVAPSAPNPTAHDDNGYILVTPTPQTSVDSSNSNELGSSSSARKSVTGGELSKEGQEEISKMLIDISNSTERDLKSANSSSSTKSSSSVTAPTTSHKTTCQSSSSSPLCPYYFLAMNKLANVELPPKVRELLLWEDPKVTGGIFGTTFVVLLSLSLFSFLTVASSLLLLALTLIGSYRFYLAVVFRIKGVYDPTFDKLSELDVSLPKDRVKQLAHLLETDINRALNQIKSILLWDNLTTSAVAYLALYFVYCVGCVFNTLTLLILALVTVFTLPKVYQVYQKPIDQALEHATSSVHALIQQITAKLPFLSKKKTQ
jgi:translation initiation factor 2 beta subunit (eIF-2beta)/eIF-5